MAATTGALGGRSAVRSTVTRSVVLLSAIGLVVAACGNGDAQEGLAVGGDGSGGTTVTTTEATDTSAGQPATSDPAGTATTPTSGSPDPVPGEAVDYFVDAGDVLAVVGVSHDDMLNVRSEPGFDFPVLAELDPTEDDLVATGNAWSTPNGDYLVEIEAGGVTGWVAVRFVAYLGGTDDITAQVIDHLGATPEVETMLDLGELVADAVLDLNTEPGAEEGSRQSVMSVAPTVGDLGEVTFDVLGFQDDSVRGLRLHVFATPSESGEGFILKSIEATALCGRGVSDGLCL